MEFSCDREVLLDALQRLAPACKSNNNIILNYVHVSNQDTVDGVPVIKLLATDREVSIECIIGGLSEGVVDFLFLHSAVTKMLQESKSDSVTFTEEEDQLVITLEGGEYRLGMVAPDSFPTMPEPPQRAAIEVKAGDMHNRLSEVITCAADKVGAKWSLTGVLFKLWQGGGEICATDTKRLALHTWGEPGTTDSPDYVEGVVPASALRMLLRILSKARAEEILSIRINQAEALFSLSATQFHSRLLEGTFVAYRNFFPKKLTPIAKINRAKLIEVLRQSIILHEKDDHRTTFKVAAGRLDLRTKNTRGECGMVMQIEASRNFSADYDPQMPLPWLEQLDDVDINVTGVEPDRPLFLIAEHGRLMLMPLSKG